MEMKTFRVLISRHPWNKSNVQGETTQNEAVQFESVEKVIVTFWECVRISYYQIKCVNVYYKIIPKDKIIN